MLCELTLERFKAFSAAEKIPVRPITLIYGPNSSGKSSVIQSLLLLKQTLIEAENPNIPLLPRGKIVDLGGYREFVSNHDVGHNLSFKLDIHKKAWHKETPLSFGSYSRVASQNEDYFGSTTTFSGFDPANLRAASIDSQKVSTTNSIAPDSARRSRQAPR